MKNAPNFRLPFYLALCIKIRVGSHKRTLILIQRLAFFLCLKSLAPQDFFHLAGCMVGAFPLFFGCKRRLMLVSLYSEVQVGCIIKRLLVVEPVAVLYWVHMTVPEKTRYRRTGCLSAERSIGTTLLFIYNYSSSKSSPTQKGSIANGAQVTGIYVPSVAFTIMPS